MFVLLSVEARRKFFYESGRKIILYSNILDNYKKDKRQLKSLNFNVSYINPNLIDQKKPFKD